MSQASAWGSFGLCSFIFSFSELKLPLKTILRGIWLSWLALLNTEGRIQGQTRWCCLISCYSISIHNWDSLAFQSPCRNIWALHEERVPYALLLVKSVYPRSWPRINGSLMVPVSTHYMLQLLVHYISSRCYIPPYKREEDFWAVKPIFLLMHCNYCHFFISKASAWRTLVVMPCFAICITFYSWR